MRRFSLSNVYSLPQQVKVVINGEWGEWSDFTQCSKTCGGGTTTRLRHCNNPSPKNGGKLCHGDSIQQKKCTIRACCKQSIISLSFSGQTKISLIIIQHKVFCLDVQLIIFIYYTALPCTNRLPDNYNKKNNCPSGYCKKIAANGHCEKTWNYVAKVKRCREKISHRWMKVKTLCKKSCKACGKNLCIRI